MDGESMDGARRRMVGATRRMELRDGQIARRDGWSYAMDGRRRFLRELQGGGGAGQDALSGRLPSSISSLIT